MKKILAFTLVIFSTAYAISQGCHSDILLKNTTIGGIPAIAATGGLVNVCLETDKAIPCTTMSVVLLYSDSALTKTIANPVSTDNKGNYSWCAASGTYNQQPTGSGIITKTSSPITIPISQASSQALSDAAPHNFTNTITTNGAFTANGIETYNGAATHSGSETFNGSETHNGNNAFTGSGNTFTILRGRVDASTFTGADMCAKVNAAWTYAVGLGLGYGEVDATGFHGEQDVAVSCFASFPATPTVPQNFVGLLKLAPDVKVVTSVTQNPPTSVFIDGGGSAWIWALTGGSSMTVNMGAQFIPSNTFDWATQKAVFTLGYSGGSTNPRGIWFQNVGVGCLPPNGTYHSGSIGIYNGLSQEGTGGERVFVYGCTIGIDIENDGSFSGSQNSGPWKQLNIQATSSIPSTETGWIGVAFCKTTSNCDENRGIDGATFSGPGSIGSTGVSVDMSNVAVRNVSSENTYYTVDVGKYHAALGVTLDNIQGEGHPTFNTQAILHITAGSISTLTATNIGANDFQRDDYMIQDEATNGLSFCGFSSITTGSPCNGATLLTPNVPLYVVSDQTGYGNSRVVFAPHPGAPNGGISIGGNAATATTASTCPTCTGGVFIQTLNADYTTSANDKGKLIRMTPAANNVTFNLPATPPSSTWWAVVQSVNLTGFTTSINSNGANLDGSPTSTTPVTVAQAQNIMIWTNGTSYYSVRWNTPYIGTTGSIGGSALAAGVCASGTVTIAGVVAGQTGRATASDGSDQDNYVVKAYASAANTATVKVCAIAAGTPTAKTYNVRILP